MFLLLRFIAKVISSVSHYIMIQPKSQVNSFEQFIFTAKILRYYMTMNYHLNHTLFGHIFKVECALFTYKVFKNDDIKYDMLPTIII